VIKASSLYRAENFIVTDGIFIDDNIIFDKVSTKGVEIP
jgi:hypothetical protein